MRGWQMISSGDGRPVVGLDALQQWLLDRHAAGIFYCTTRRDPELLCMLASTGLPVDQVDILAKDSPADVDRPFHRDVRACPVPAAAARAILGVLPLDFLMVDDAEVVRLAYDDHDRLVVGFVEPDGATDRYRLARDVLWITGLHRVGE
jgi:hypothetical protein